mgnify:CR=1 FL=1|tara:strand:+ start:372 stop:962 length:591 start_codon:yes stop_codon:yes gene_type:complete
MGLVKRAADLTYTFRFIRMLVMDWKNWDAYKLGIIDENGKRDRSVNLDNDEKKSAYTPFIRLCANVKRLVSKIPGGGTKLGSFASALFLIKEHCKLKDKDISQIIERCNIDKLDFLTEANSNWFLLEDKQLIPGIYQVRNPKILNKNFEEWVFAKDQIRVVEDSYPVGDVFGLDIYEAIHVKTNQKIYVTISEIYK